MFRCIGDMVNCVSCVSPGLALVLGSLWPLGASVALPGLCSAEVSFMLDAIRNPLSCTSG